MHPAITDTPSDLAERLDRLADALDAAGVLRDPAWRAALYAVPRHLFIPDRAWILHDGSYLELDRRRNPDQWWDAVYRVGEPIITQFNDGERSLPPGVTVQMGARRRSMSRRAGDGIEIPSCGGAAGNTAWVPRNSGMPRVG